MIRLALILILAASGGAWGQTLPDLPNCDSTEERAKIEKHCIVDMNKPDSMSSTVGGVTYYYNTIIRQATPEELEFSRKWLQKYGKGYKP